MECIQYKFIITYFALKFILQILIYLLFASYNA
jgi:hypothetical protein